MFQLANYADPASVAAAGCTSSKKRKLRRLCAKRHDLEKCARPDKGREVSQNADAAHPNTREIRALPAASGWGIARWTHFHRASPDNNTKVPGFATILVGISFAPRSAWGGAFIRVMDGSPFGLL